MIWKRLKHPNIVPLLGVTLLEADDEGDIITPLQLISDWMPDGNLQNYIKKNPDMDRVGVVGVPPVVIIPCLLTSPAIRHRQGSFLPPPLQRDSRGPQGSTCFL